MTSLLGRGNSRDYTEIENGIEKAVVGGLTEVGGQNMQTNGNGSHMMGKKEGASQDHIGEHFWY